METKCKQTPSIPDMSMSDGQRGQLKKVSTDQIKLRMCTGL